MTLASTSQTADNWRLYHRFIMLVVFALASTTCILTAVLIARKILEAGWPAIATSLEESRYFFFDPPSVAFILAASGSAVAFGAIASWAVRTRKMRMKAILVCLLLLPAALPYEAIVWISRALPTESTYIAYYALLYRYMPISFVFGYLTVSRYSADVLAVASSLGVSETRLVICGVLPRVWFSFFAQLIFVALIMAADHVGMSYASGGRLTSLGNVIDSWSRTTDNSAVAYVLALAVACVGAVAAGGANVIGWWQQSIRDNNRPASPIGSPYLVWITWACALPIAGAPLAVALVHVRTLEGGLSTFTGVMIPVGISTLSYTLLGVFLASVTAFTVYLVVQDRDTRQPSIWLSVCVAVSMFGLLVPPVVRGEFFLLPTTMIARSAGNALWAAFWMWIVTFPVITAVAALHPVSRNNHLQSVLESAGIPVRLRLIRSMSHARPVIFSAALLWLFFGIFDTSVTRSMAGTDRTFGIWFRDQVSTTYDPGIISAGIIFAYFVVFGLGITAMIFSNARTSYGR